MATIKGILPDPKEGQMAFILDHGKIENGSLKYQDDVTTYGWNTKQFNKLKPGAFVLNRHPGKITKDRKFEIYAGGYVESIKEIDDQGNVVATITHAFDIVPPIKQGDPFIENFVWDSKKKKPGTWEHFWNQYGMNTISFTDFENLTRDVHCIPVDQVGSIVEASEMSEEEIQELQEDPAKGFHVTVDESGPTHKKKERKYCNVGRKVDWDRVQKSRNKTGILGEEIAMDIISKMAQAQGLREPIHVSKEEGDGLGYDIRYWEANGKEVHVEVKASKDRYADGFEMSAREIEASKDTNCKYLIYRLYDLNVKTRECRLKVYEGPIDTDNFKLVTKSIMVYQK